jgi:hypothetical protein
MQIAECRGGGTKKGLTSRELKCGHASRTRTRYEVEVKVKAEI